MTLARGGNLGVRAWQVGAIGLGCMGMSQSYGPADELNRSRPSTARWSWAATFSTPPRGYGPFPNEELLGRALPRSGATRWSSPPSSASDSRTATAAGRRPTAAPAHDPPRRSRRRCSRLQTDHIDLLYQHRIDRQRADRGGGRHGRRADQRRQGALLRPVGSGRRRRSGARMPRSTVSGRCKANIRCGSAESGGGRDPAGAAMNSASAWCRSARSAAASWRAACKRAEDYPRRRHPAHRSALSGARTSTPTFVPRRRCSTSLRPRA